MRAEIEFETHHDNPEKVALSVAPDNTDEMDTQLEGKRVVTRIERDTVGSLLSTADDYIRNVEVASEVLGDDTQR